MKKVSKVIFYNKTYILYILYILPQPLPLPVQRRYRATVCDLYAIRVIQEIEFSKAGRE